MGDFTSGAIFGGGPLGSSGSACFAQSGRGQPTPSPAEFATLSIPP